MKQLNPFADRELWTKNLVERKCPLCDSSFYGLLSSRMQFGFELNTVICCNCSFVFTNPLPSLEIYQSFYTDAYAYYYGNITTTINHISSKTVPKEAASYLDLIDSIKDLNHCSLLEVGPGKGAFLHWARFRGAQVLGAEPNRSFFEIIESQKIPCINLSLEQLGTEFNQKFDVIVMFHVLEHFYDPNKALEHCYDLLKADGIIVVEVPNVKTPFRSLDRFFFRYVHPSNFSPETLTAFFSKHRFTTVQMWEPEGTWKSPRNLFAIAQKTKEHPAPAANISDEVEIIYQSLMRYRTQWNLIWRQLWHVEKWRLNIRVKLKKFYNRNLTNIIALG